MTKFRFTNGIVLETDDDKVIQQVITASANPTSTHTAAVKTPTPTPSVPAAAPAKMTAYEMGSTTNKPKRERKAPPFVVPFLKGKKNSEGLQATARIVLASINQQLFPESIKYVNDALLPQLNEYCKRTYHQLVDAYEITKRYHKYSGVYSHSLMAAMYIICLKDDEEQTRKLFTQISFYEAVASTVKSQVRPTIDPTNSNKINYGPTSQENQTIVKKYVLDRVLGTKAISAGS